MFVGNTWNIFQKCKIYLLIYIYLNIFSIFNAEYCIWFYTLTSLTGLVVLECLFIYLHQDDLVDFETQRRNKSDKRIFITDCAICCIKYRIMVTIIFNKDAHTYIWISNSSFLKYKEIVKYCQKKILSLHRAFLCM